MSWQNEQIIDDWRGQPNVTIGRDSDGDFGLMDKEAQFSLVFKPKGAVQLRDWLNREIEKDEKNKNVRGGADNDG